MDAFVSRKRRKVESPEDVVENNADELAGPAPRQETEDYEELAGSESRQEMKNNQDESPGPAPRQETENNKDEPPGPPPRQQSEDSDEESTDFKLALLASLHPKCDDSTLLEALLASDGSVDKASSTLQGQSSTAPSPLKRPRTIGHQSSLTSYTTSTPANTKRALQKGKTLHLYDPKDIETNTPCSIIHNFLPPSQATALLHQLLAESTTFSRNEFQLFNRVVQSPHTFAFYVDSLSDALAQQSAYVYNGVAMSDVRQAPPEMLNARPLVEAAVNAEIQRRIRDFHTPRGAKLKHQSPHAWRANTAFVNCYNGPGESVGWHADQLTYLGPQAVIGSLSLGVAREMRVRRVAAESGDSSEGEKGGTGADAHARPHPQISIHLPHNTLLVMHASMQEEWKHCIAPAAAIDPHPLAGGKRINVTYRFYKEELHPRYTPRCRCGVPTVLRCVTKKESRGRYVWMCHAGYVPGEEGCGFVRWARFDADGVPEWAWGEQDRC